MGTRNNNQNVKREESEIKENTDIVISSKQLYCIKGSHTNQAKLPDKYREEANEIIRKFIEAKFVHQVSGGRQGLKANTTWSTTEKLRIDFQGYTTTKPECLNIQMQLGGERWIQRKKGEKTTYATVLLEKPPSSSGTGVTYEYPDEVISKAFNMSLENNHSVRVLTNYT
jgi:hypothetical protein